MSVKGWHVEWWHHTVGCRHYMKVLRNTVTNEIRAVVPPSGDVAIPAGEAPAAHRDPAALAAAAIAKVTTP